MNRPALKRIVLVVITPLLLVMLIAAVLIVADGLNDDLHHADVAIVLGNKVEENGEPSDRLRARLDRTVELYRDGLFREVIVSGGIGDEGFDEASAMKRYLVEQGMPEGQIHEDNEGATTYLTAMNARRIMNERGWQSAMVISQYFHVSRSKLAHERFGISPVYSAHADFFELRDPYSIVREVVGYGAYLFREYP